MHRPPRLLDGTLSLVILTLVPGNLRELNAVQVRALSPSACHLKAAESTQGTDSVLCDVP